MDGINSIRRMKREIDARSITRISELIDFVVKQEDLDMYYMLTDNDVFELMDSYIEKKKSIYNRNLIVKYYHDLGANLIE